MNKHLLIIFVKNPELGKVKTRLAATIGDEAALSIYHQLLEHTKRITQSLDVDKIVFYSGFVDDQDLWSPEKFQKAVQTGESLGDKMSNAFKAGFENGYESICIIGSDCYELSEEILASAFQALSGNHETVVGPAKDGGYYLLGMNKHHRALFENKAWSTDEVYPKTIADFESLGLSYSVLPTLSDIDQEKDLEGTDLLVNRP
ncbi:MAG: TIGR04282 family arsenosugar biosynthesis glycosyltransferase [Bacteroidota bacterium]